MKKYLLSFGFALAGLLATTTAFNALVDPWDVVAQTRSDGVIRLDSAIRTAKAYALRGRRPDCLVMGTSRMEYGVDPERLPARCQRPYNAGLPLAHIYEIRRYLEHALRQAPVSDLLLGLDFVMFRETPRVTFDFSEGRLAHLKSWRSSGWSLPEVTGFAIGFDTTRRSLRMLRRPIATPAFEPRGNRNPAKLEAGLATGTVHRYSAEQFHFLGRFVAPPTAFVTEVPSTVDELQQIIELAHQHGIRLRMAFTPIHASYHALLLDLGRHEQFLAWKRAVARLTEKAHHTGVDVELWDFATLNAMTTEPIPPAGAAQRRMLWYWESTHFRPELGELMVAQIYASPAADHAPAGYRVIIDELAHRDAEYRQQFSAWLTRQPQEVAWVKSWLKDTRDEFALPGVLASLNDGRDTTEGGTEPELGRHRTLMP